jgi:hypothetical protein
VVINIQFEYEGKTTAENIFHRKTAIHWAAADSVENKVTLTGKISSNYIFITIYLQYQEFVTYINPVK